MNITTEDISQDGSQSSSEGTGEVGTSGTDCIDIFDDQLLSEMLDSSSSDFRGLSPLPLSPSLWQRQLLHQPSELNEQFGVLNPPAVADSLLESNDSSASNSGNGSLYQALVEEDSAVAQLTEAQYDASSSAGVLVSPSTPPNKRKGRSPGATLGSGERHKKQSRTDLLHRAPTVLSPCIRRSAEACDVRRSAEASISKLHNELEAYSGLDVDMSKEDFDKFGRRMHRVKFSMCCCHFFERGHPASKPCACPNLKEYASKSGTRCVEPFNWLVPRLKKDGTVGHDEKRWAVPRLKKDGTVGKSGSLPQIQLPQPARAACGTGGCLNLFYAVKLIIGYLQVKGGCANKSRKDLQMKDHKGRTIVFSEQNFMRAKKALVVVGLSSDEWVDWDLVPGFVNRLGGREAVRGYMRELFSSSTSSSSISSSSSSASSVVTKNRLMELLQTSNLTGPQARQIFLSALEEHFGQNTDESKTV